jgi:hypothetical protein
MNAGPILAVVGACAVLFAAFYAAAELISADDGVRVQARSALPPMNPPVGRTLALEGVPRLPDLGRPPRPKPEPEPAAPPQVASAPSDPVSPQPPPSDLPVSDPEAEAPLADPPQEPSAPAPQAAAPPTDFYDSGG